MSIPIDVDINDPARELATYGAGAVVGLERAAAATGPWTLVATQLLAAATQQYSFADPSGTPTSWYRSYLANAAATDFSARTEPRQVDATPTIVSTLQVAALVKTGLSNYDLAELIAREEELLAAEVGELVGARTETFLLTDRTVASPVRLARPTTLIAVTEDNVTTTDVRLVAGRTVQRLLATGWGTDAWRGVVEVTYTPGDLARITTWVIELVRSRLAETGHESESIDSYTYNRGDRSYPATMAAAIADILGLVDRASGSPSRRLRSLRVSTDATPRPWAGTVRP